MSRRAIRDFCCDNVLWINFIIVVIGSALFIFGIHAFIEVHKDAAKRNYEEGYLDACKDFYKGKTKYDLVKNDDGTVVWKKVEKVEAKNK